MSWPASISLRAALCALGLAVTLAGCGSSPHATDPTARGAVEAFNADISAGHDRAACALMTPAVQRILIAADTGASPDTTCATAVGSAGGRRFLAPLAMSRAQVSAAAVGQVGSGLVQIRPGPHATKAYVLSETDGTWLISSL